MEYPLFDLYRQLPEPNIVPQLQQDFEPMPPGPKNPYGNGFRAVETDLTSELKAMRCADPFKGRVWKIKNPESIHPITGKRGCYRESWKDLLGSLSTFSNLR